MWKQLVVVGLCVLPACRARNTDLKGNQEYGSSAERTRDAADQRTFWDPQFPAKKERVCKDKAALQQDFYEQLMTHRSFGDPAKFFVEDRGNRVQDTRSAELFGFYQSTFAQFGNKPNSFKDIGVDKMMDGADPRDLAKLRVGDVLLNMTFGSPKHRGHFYSKRGMVHTRLVISCMVDRTTPCERATNVTPTSQVAVTVADGGWGNTSTLSNMNSQTIWLRPQWSDGKPLDSEDLGKLVAWAKLLQARDYDNQLIDDVATFRNELAKRLNWVAPNANSGGSMNLVNLPGVNAPNPNPNVPDPVRPVVQPQPPPQPARPTAKQVAQRAIKDIYENGTYTKGNGQQSSMKDFAPEVFWADGNNPEAKFYCSELASTAFTYLGFRLYGETALDLLSKFSKAGNNIEWAYYLDALSGFGAADDVEQVGIHATFWNFFRVFDETRKHPQLGQVWPQATQGAGVTFAKAISALLNSPNDPAKAGLEGLVAANVPGANDLLTNMNQVRAGIEQSFGRQGMSMTDALNVMYQSNQSFGPHHFMENKDHFVLQGVWYNQNPRWRAKWVVDWTFHAIDPITGNNINEAEDYSTTSYANFDPSVTGCVVR